MLEERIRGRKKIEMQEIWKEKLASLWNFSLIQQRNLLNYQFVNVILNRQNLKLLKQSFDNLSYEPFTQKSAQFFDIKYLQAIGRLFLLLVSLGISCSSCKSNSCLFKQDDVRSGKTVSYFLEISSAMFPRGLHRTEFTKLFSENCILFELPRLWGFRCRIVVELSLSLVKFLAELFSAERLFRAKTGRRGFLLSRRNFSSRKLFVKTNCLLRSGCVSRKKYPPGK